MLTYADVCRRMLTYADECRKDFFVVEHSEELANLSRAAADQFEAARRISESNLKAALTQKQVYEALS